MRNSKLSYYGLGHEGYELEVCRSRVAMMLLAGDDVIDGYRKCPTFESWASNSAEVLGICRVTAAMIQRQYVQIKMVFLNLQAHDVSGLLRLTRRVVGTEERVPRSPFSASCSRVIKSALSLPQVRAFSDNFSNKVTDQIYGLIVYSPPQYQRQKLLLMCLVGLTSTDLWLECKDASVALLQSLVHLESLFVTGLHTLFELEFPRLRAQVLQLVT